VENTTLPLLLPHVQPEQTAQVVEYTRREFGEWVPEEIPFHEERKEKRGGMKKKLGKIIFFSLFFPTYSSYKLSRLSNTPGGSSESWLL